MGFRRYEYPMHEQELMAVDRLRPKTERIYRRLRQLVDMKSFTLGDRPDNQASYAKLRDVVSWCPPQGSKEPEWRPDERELRCAIDEMSRVGLVERAFAVRRGMCLRFVLMAQDYCARFDERRMNVAAASERTREERSSESRVNIDSPAGERSLSVDMNAGCDEEERHISNNQNIYTHIACAREDDPAAPLRIQLAKVARSSGVKVSGAQHPDVIGWADDGVTVGRLLQAIERARVHIAAPEWIPTKYITGVLNSMREEDAAKSKGLRVIRGGRNEQPAPGWKHVPEPSAFKGGAVMNGDVTGGVGDDWVE